MFCSLGIYHLKAFVFVLLPEPGARQTKILLFTGGSEPTHLLRMLPSEALGSLQQFWFKRPTLNWAKALLLLCGCENPHLRLLTLPPLLLAFQGPRKNSGDFSHVFALGTLRFLFLSCKLSCYTTNLFLLFNLPFLGTCGKNSVQVFWFYHPSGTKSLKPFDNVFSVRAL